MENHTQIPGYETYAISTAGEVKNLKTGRILKNSNHRYSRVCLCHNRHHKSFYIHTLMAMTYLGHTPNGTQNVVVDHVNNDKHDNRLENLQLTTQRHNTSKDKQRDLPTGVVKVGKRFKARIWINNIITRKYLGTYDTPKAAHQAYLAAIPD